MNVFRSRKKSIGEADAGKRPSLDDAPPMPMPKNSRGLFGRKKTAIEQPKPELDLSSVLPSDNEFRTSLIMPNLSQRFSMLREQDDPHSKLGKASDDSVLYPKRQSRLNLFEGSLDDIAEVSSLAGSFKPPFAQEGRVSYASDGGYDSDGGISTNGSMMDRAKPGQGNKFFGGRQKVYKIPQGATSKNNSRPGSAGRGKPAMGKAVYEDDISTSLWQRLRQEERSKRSFDFDLNERSADGRRSPSLAGYNRNRETSSSTNSNERNSSAATSMTSMADNSSSYLPASMIKGDRPLNKRLYGQNIEQQVHDQQSFAVQRLNSTRNARGGFQTLAPKRAPSGSSRPGAISAATSVSSLRSGSTSPAQAPSNGFDFGLDKQPALLHTPDIMSVRDIDSGYQGSPNYTPPISPAADPTLVAHLDPNDHGKATASGAFNKPKARYDEQQFAQRQLQLQEGRETPVQSNSRSETPIDRPNRTRQDSDTSAGASRQTNFSRLSGGRSVSRERNSGKRITGQALNGSYLAADSDSEDEPDFTPQQSRSSESLGRRASSSERTHSSSRVMNTPLQNEIHPALRAPIQEEEEHDQFHGAQPSNFDSPVLGQPSGGLSAMVRGHFRNMSDASSVYPESEPPERNTADSPTFNDDDDAQPSSPQAALADRAKQMLDAAQRARAGSTSQPSSPASRTSPSAPKLRQQSSIDEIVRKPGHARGPSTETQQERDAFADELAERRRQVEQKLRNIAESRKETDTSPNNSSANVLLKKSSKGSLVEPSGPLGKLKKLMPGSAPGSGASTPIAEPDSPPQFPTHGMSSDTNLQDRAAAAARNGDQAPMRDRDIAAERRARHAEALRSPRGNGAPTPRGRVDARRQQFAGPSGNLPNDFTERINANPDQGKPRIHPAGRAMHYSPPRNNQGADPKPMLPPQGPQGRQRGPPSVKGQTGRAFSPMDQNQYPRQASTERSNMPPSRGDRGQSPNYGSNRVQSPVGGAQMITPGTFPPPLGSPNGGPAGDVKYMAARKRSVSKAEISTPMFLSGTYDTRSVVDLPPGASLENGMAEVRAAEAAMMPPPVPPINPRRRAMGAIKTLGRSQTGSPESEGSRGGSPVALRRQMSEGTNLRGNSPVKGY